MLDARIGLSSRRIQRTRRIVRAETRLGQPYRLALGFLRLAEYCDKEGYSSMAARNTFIVVLLWLLLLVFYTAVLVFKVFVIRSCRSHGYFNITTFCS